MAKNNTQAAQDMLANSSTSEDISETKLNQLGAEIVGAMDDSMQLFYSNFADWAALAHTLPDQRHGTVLISKVKYRINQVLQALWQGCYGNRTTEEVKRGERLERDSVRYSDKEYMDFRTGMVSSLDAPAEGAAEQMSFEQANILTRAYEAELRFATFKPLLDAFTKLYELTCEETWIYKPWDETDKRTVNSAAVATMLMRQRAKAPAAE